MITCAGLILASAQTAVAGFQLPIVVMVLIVGKDVLLLLKQREGLQSLLLFRASCDFSRLDFLVRCRSASLAGRYGQRCTVVFFL